MDVVIETVRSFPCHTKRFKINKLDADEADFGKAVDTKPDNGTVFTGCNDCAFIIESDKKEFCMKKYHLNKEEYESVCNILKGKLSVGSCVWCV